MGVRNDEPFEPRSLSKGAFHVSTHWSLCNEMENVHVLLCVGYLVVAGFNIFIISIGGDKMDATKTYATSSLVLLAAVLWLLEAAVEAKTIKVDCSKATLNAAVLSAQPGDTILVSGVCSENVVVPEQISQLTLDGQNAAMINGGDAIAGRPAAISITGRGITVKGFTIFGGGLGVDVISGGTAIIDTNTIQFTGLHGLKIGRGASATVANNTIQNNPGNGIFQGNHSESYIGLTGPQSARVPAPNMIRLNTMNGITVNRASSAEIGFNVISNNSGLGIGIGQTSHARIGGLSDVAANSGNTISGNGNDGVRVEESSSANISQNTISNNSGYGIRIIRASHATIGDNTVNANTQDGVRVEENSAVVLDAANTTTSNNAKWGIRCRLGGYVTGTIGGLNGTSGQKNFGTTLLISTAGGNDPWGPILDGDTTTLTVTGQGANVKLNSEGCIDNTVP